jgi:predicted RNA-binding protein associated with RNAse of E/G family
MSAGPVRILYRRPPDREQLFEQARVSDEAGYVVTLLEEAPLRGPVHDAAGAVILEPGAPVVWLTYPDRWYDIGRFHLRDGTFTGWYANVLTPVRMEGDRWETTDLFLDVWLPASGRGVQLLDVEEFAQALQAGWLEEETAERARATAASLAAGAGIGSWPPPEASRWTLESARDHLARGAGRDLRPEIA